MALEKIEGCQDVYIDSKVGIMLAMSVAKQPDAEALDALLKPHKISVVKVEKSDQALY